MLSSLDPALPVYCVHPHRYAVAAREFAAGFPGRVLYAVKANNHPMVLEQLHAAGIAHFDCASLDEIALIKSRIPEASCYFMNPVRLPGAALEAFQRFDTRHFMVDHIDSLAPLVNEISASECVIFARMAVHHESAVEDLSSKFGARPEHTAAILEAIRTSGAEAALAFNVGSGVRSPAAYGHAIDVAASVLRQLPFRLRLVDIGGGFPLSYPGFDVPPLSEFFATIRQHAANLPLADNGLLLAEPGRALAAPGLSTVARVLLRKADRLYLNDGMYGGFWELRFNGHKQLPVRAYRNAARLQGQPAGFAAFGPTCDSTDRLPEPLVLPRDIREGDFLEFDNTGAYSLSGRGNFNGFDGYTVVRIHP